MYTCLQLSRKLLLFLSGITCALTVNAQVKPAPQPDHCASSRVMETLYRQMPAARERAIRQEAVTRKFIADKQQQRVAAAVAPASYTIPVVFHVNDPSNPYKVTMEQIRSAMDILNQDYNALNADFANIDPRFKSLAANLHITFRLADIDPDGNPTTGVTYHYNDLDGRSPDGYGTAVKSVSYWPGEKYLNIWIVSEVEQKGVFNNSGWSFLPDDWVFNNKLDGIVYNWRYLGAPGVGVSENGQPGMKRVLTHEVGHFLNLQHTFEGGCASPGDYVDDTPPTTVNTGCNLNANSCGSVANVENYMDYASCTKMFTIGQSQRMNAALNSVVARRNNLWSAANLAATLLTSPAKRFLFSTVNFTETDANTGVVATDMGNGTYGNATIRGLDGARFSRSSGLLVAGSDFSVQNLPAGLSVKIELQSDSTATFSFTGTATQHAVANNNDSVKITFLNPAVAGGAGTLYSTVTRLGIHFINPYKIVYNDMTDVVTDSLANFTWFSLNAGDATYGAWFHEGNLRFETYQKGVVCQGTSLNITPLDYNTTIGAASSFVNGGAFPNEHFLYSPTYKNWDGKTAFIGIRFTINGKMRYGWMRATVLPGGKRYIIHDYAYNEKPDTDIRAGEVSSAELSWSDGNFKEAFVNDGSFKDTTTLYMYSTRFAAAGTMTKNTHFTIANLPAGLDIQIVVAADRRTAKVYLTGKAFNHAAANTPANVQLALLPAAFEGLSATFPSASRKLNITFRNPYQIKYVDVPDMTVNTANPWTYFTLEDAPAVELGIWIENGFARFETYKREMVCQGTTRNISLLPVNTVVGSSSNFVAGGDYPDEHNLSSASYTSWNGQTGYAGFRFTVDGETNYCWFRFRVAADGRSYTLLDYAYNTKPGESIRTGQQVSDNTNTPPDAAFTANKVNVKKGQSVQFTDQSTGTITSRRWTFAGGSPATDTARNPLVTYNTVGVYAVTLIVSNTTTSDTLQRAGYITVTNDTTSVPGNYCAANTVLDYNYIKTVKFAGINRTSAWNGYSNFTTDKATVNPGKSYTLEIIPNIDYWPDISVAAWIDWNNDKVFNEATEKVYNRRGAGPYKPTIAVPANAVTGNTMMRVRLGYGNNLISCGTDTYQGEVEDYTVTITTDSTGALTARIGAPVDETPFMHGTESVKVTSPFTDQLHIWYTARQQGNAVIRLYDMRGHLHTQQLQHAREGQNTFRIAELGALPAGMYIVEITSGGKRVAVKVIK
ncbi:T9SS type A sorting domain-containing protein [Chitinophaga sp. Mgbs1]|uniref:T9SS type A sorting domain-containing protein n=1 Tax=Chitinophaga solisilvae TaxID=1233460 RepID=A0A3S1B1Z0_9BACT|nr:T9SS type A sorting domain-containing protein [Chitinophaga solisilvae]